MYISKKITKAILVGLVCLSAILVILFALYVWFDWTYTGNLRFYDKSKGNINSVYACEDGVLLELDDGQLYLSSSWHARSAHREFRNVKGLGDDPDLMVNVPVLVYEGGVDKIIPFDTLEFLIIDEGGTLYRFYDMELTHLANGVCDASIMRGGNSEFVAWYIDTDSALHKITGEEDEVVLDGAREIEVSDSAVFCLNNDGVLGEIVDGEAGATLEPLMENVLSFEASRNTVYQEEEGSLSLSDHFLLSALTNDNELYLYGTLSTSSERAKDGVVTKHNDWTLISGNVVKHSSCRQGVAYITTTGEAYYYGYDPYFMSREFVNQKIIDSGARDISLSYNCLVIEVNEGWKLYGQSVFYNSSGDTYLAQPVFWDKKKLNTNS